MKKPDHISGVLNLKIGESVIIHPDDEDSVNALAARVNRQVHRYRKSIGRWFRVLRVHDGIEVTAVLEGEHRKLSPLLSLQLGERLLYADRFTPSDYKPLSAKLVYLWDKKQHGFFAEQDPDGKVYLRRFVDSAMVRWNDVLREQGLPIPRLTVVCNPLSWSPYD